MNTPAPESAHTPTEGRFADVTCPTCGAAWWAQCSRENAFRCLECKAIYTGEMLVASDLLAALKSLLAEVDKRCGGRAEGNSALVTACDASRDVIAKAEGGK